MKVKDKVNGNVYQVYDISYDRSGYPHFLIYRDNQWVKRSAKFFIPLVSGQNVEHKSNDENDSLDKVSAWEFFKTLLSYDRSTNAADRWNKIERNGHSDIYKILSSYTVKDGLYAIR